MQEMDEQAALLLYKYIAGQELEEEDMALLRGWLSASPNNQALLVELRDEKQLESDIKALMAIDEDAALKKLQEQMARERKLPGIFSTYLLRYAATALLVLAVVVGVYTWYQHSANGLQAKKEGGHQRFKNDIAPGGANAVLQLADGSTIAPDSFGDGIVNYQDGTVIQKKEKGQLVYDASHANTGNPGKALVYNTITTPRKSDYRLVLPDGSRVWLNAGSALRFPVAFRKERREVELSGEAYFEVASLASAGGAKTPFVVKIRSATGNTGEVEVQGTQFNINAYPDEPTINTSLVEGRVVLRPVVNAPGQPGSTALVAGQQARLAKDGTVQLLRPDMEEVIAWKNDFFLFHDTDMETIMRMLSRWYDVNVVYEGKITQTFNGKIPRNTPLSKLLAILELTGEVYFTIDAKTVTVKSR